MGIYLGKNFGGQAIYGMAIVGIKVAQLNVLLELQLRTSLMISQIPVAQSANNRVDKDHCACPIKSAYDQEQKIE